MRTKAAALLLCLLPACIGRYGGEQPPSDSFYFPTALALHPNGSFLYVASSNFDLRYQHGTVLAVDLEEFERLHSLGIDENQYRESILSDDGVMTDSFAGKMLPLVFRNGEVNLFMTVRGSNVLQRIEVDDSGDGRHLSCSESKNKGLARCDDSDYWSFMLEPDDPFGLAVVKLKSLSQDGLSYSERSYVLISCLRNEEIVGVRADDFSESFSFKTDVAGFSSMAVVAAKGERTRVLASGRYSDIMVLFDPQAMFERSGKVERLGLGVEPLSSRDYARDMVASPDGRKVYVAMRSPDGIAVLDTTGWPLTNAPKLAGFVQLKCGPSQLAYLPREPASADLLYVTCTVWSRVFVIELRGNTVATMIEDAGRAPFAIAASWNRVFVASFEDGRIAVIDSSASDPGQHRLLGRIGRATQ